jgi:hypothetical protein
MDKDKLQEMLDAIYPEFCNVKMRATNLDLGASFAGYKIDWETGLVLDKE